MQKDNLAAHRDWFHNTPLKYGCLLQPVSRELETGLLRQWGSETENFGFTS